MSTLSTPYVVSVPATIVIKDLQGPNQFFSEVIMHMVFHNSAIKVLALGATVHGANHTVSLVKVTARTYN